ncbi:MAG: phosphatase PAP2 family protein, partial [Candidatus Eiseniibacteriota bacterium]
PNPTPGDTTAASRGGPEAGLERPALEPDRDAPPRRRLWLGYRDRGGPSKYLEWLWKDAVNLYTRPLFWRGDEWEGLGVRAAITAAAIPADDAVRDAVRRNRQEAVGDVLEAVNDTYGTLRMAYAGAGLLLIGLAAGDGKLADTGFLSAESVIYASQTAVITKRLLGRERPAYAKDPWRFHGWDRRHDSFVSEDATIAFALSSSVSEVWRTRWVTWPAYGLAVAVAAARVDRDAHWLSDVVGAGFLGAAVGRSLVRLHDPREPRSGRVGVVPWDGGIGLTVRF